MSKVEKVTAYVGPVVAILCICFAISVIIITFIKVHPQQTVNDPAKDVNLLIEDIGTSITKGRTYFYIVESAPRCEISQAAISGKLRSVVEEALKAGMKIKVLVPVESVDKEKARAFLSKAPHVEMRIAGNIPNTGFRVSGSFVCEETHFLDNDKRILKRYPYAPRYALILKKRFEGLWDAAQPVS